MRISDWSSDVCSSDLSRAFDRPGRGIEPQAVRPTPRGSVSISRGVCRGAAQPGRRGRGNASLQPRPGEGGDQHGADTASLRSEEHTSELQSLMRISYAVFCLKKKKHYKKVTNTTSITDTNH